RVTPDELRAQYSNPVRPRRNLEPEQLLDRQHEDELVVLVGEVVNPRRVRDRLPPRLLLHVLLEARVDVADLGVDTDDDLAVEVDDQPQDAVRRGVIRAEVDGQDVVGVLHRGIDLEYGRDRRRDPRSLVNRVFGQARAGGESHYSSPENRTGSPPIG